MSGLQSTFFVVDLLGMVALLVAVGLAAVAAGCGEGPRMRRGAGR